MPAFNEEEAIAASLRSLLALDYPEDKLELVVINDGSTDRTIDEIRAVAAESPRVQVIDFPENRGKRAAMAAGIRATAAEVIAFVDSDSVLEPDALRILVQGFADERVGAICGHADVLNLRASWLTKMQAVRYFVAFKVVKAAESVFNAVTCCSGCFSAYRREAIMPRLDWWENQTFLGAPSTFGDDRSLTNCVLRRWQRQATSRAPSATRSCPESFRTFMKQQLRWKRSWTRESLIVSTFIWRKHPLAALATYVGILLPLLAPFTAVRAVVWQPLVEGAGAPLIYLARRLRRWRSPTASTTRCATSATTRSGSGASSSASSTWRSCSGRRTTRSSRRAARPGARAAAARPARRRWPRTEPPSPRAWR